MEASVERIDVVYVCSNAAIADQNIRRLKVMDEGFVRSTRLTLLAKDLRDMDQKRVNFLSLTPATAFGPESARADWALGRADERAIIFHMLRDIFSDRRSALRLLLQGYSEDKGWSREIDKINQSDLDKGVIKAFQAKVETNVELWRELGECLELFGRQKSRKELWSKRGWLVGRLRTELAKIGVERLEPDLVILDEFQRFKHLLDNSIQNQEMRVLVNHFFTANDARILLLSATPFKPYTIDLEAGGEDHFNDFMATLKFLFKDDQAKLDEVRELMGEHRKAMRSMGRGGGSSVKDKLEAALLKVMCRTERVATTRDRNSMLADVEQKVFTLPSDLRAAADVGIVAREAESKLPVEYWKSAPYLLNFAKEYQFRKEILEKIIEPSDEVLRALAPAEGRVLDRERLLGYQPVEPGNPRMRALFADCIDSGLWRLLWMTPSLPYSEPGGVYKDLAGATKTLVFSSWRMVPEAISVICSYEAERRMLGGVDVRYDKLHDRFKALLRFTLDSGRPANMALVPWCIPFPALASAVDPLEIALRSGGGPISQAKMRTEARQIVTKLVEVLPEAGGAGRVDERWYWAAPMLLKGQEFFSEWLGVMVNGCDGIGDDDDSDNGEGLRRHLELLLKAPELELGPKPKDLVEVLADLALAAPGNCALRALKRGAPELAWENFCLTYSASWVAEGFRRLFNQPEAIVLIRREGEDGAGRVDGKRSDEPSREPYWRRTLQYCLDGNIQAMLDEQVHMLFGEPAPEPGRSEGEDYDDEALEGSGGGGGAKILDDLGEGDGAKALDGPGEGYGAKALEEGSGEGDDAKAPDSIVANDDKVNEIVDKIFSAMTIRAAKVGFDELKEGKEGGLEADGFETRGRFAFRFGKKLDGDQSVESRAMAVREAFNSPFRPFVLASTSIGQEGLDFHTWCHAVTHWNLPGNPVDLEQREGRVQRFKGHAVRRNLAHKFGLKALAKHPNLSRDGWRGDPWKVLFDLALAQRPSWQNDIVPFWVFEDGPVKIQRRLPLISMSWEAGSIRRLKAELAAYRMVFGQPRQEDLLASLNLAPGISEADLSGWLISLNPPAK